MSNSIASYKDALDRLHHYLSRFVQLSKQEFALFLPYFEIREFDKKVKVIDKGEVERYLNIVAWGVVRKYLPVRNRELTVQLASEGVYRSQRTVLFLRSPAVR